MATSEKQNKNPKAGLDFNAIGTSGLKQSGGMIDEEWHPKLRGIFGPKMYREMADSSSIIGSIQYLFESLVRQVEWRVEPAAPEAAAEEQAEFLESCLLDMDITFEDFISEVLSFLPYGWALFEEVYKLRKGESDDLTTSSKFDDGKIGWRKLALRSQDTLDHWEFDPDNRELLGMHQLDQSVGIAAFIPIGKAILFRTRTTKDNPEGRSIYRNAVDDYFFLKRISMIEAIGIERDLTGMLVMEVPFDLLIPDATDENKAILTMLQKMLSEVKRDERLYAMVPPEVDNEGNPTGYKMKLLSTGGKHQIDTAAVKHYYKTNILQSVLAQFLQLGMDNVGSFALASSQTNLFAVALGAYLGIIASTFNRFGVARLMKFNGVHPDLWPELVHGDIETPELDKIGKYIESLSKAGTLPADEAITRKLLEFANLPMPENHEPQVPGEEVGEGEPVTKHRRQSGLILNFHGQKTKKTLRNR